ncbi:hypothetical protein AAC387_Pa09g1722 [Persea americana]
MAHDSHLPCDAEGACMACKATPSEEEKLICGTCATPWHVPCLSSPPPTLSSALQWECPDCSPAGDDPAAGPSSAPSVDGGLIAAIRAIEADGTLTEAEKARKRQRLMSGGGSDGGAVAETPSPDNNGRRKKTNDESDDILDLLDESFKCSFCMQLPERPVTTPCGHNFCLKCFQKWVGQGKRSCAKCRHPIPSKMASQPRINSALVVAIRMARTAKSVTKDGPLKVYHFVQNQNRPDKAFTTERAKKAGKANACSGKIFVTVPPDHFGPILAENDPVRKQGVLVGESWEDRMECRQWGAHLPHVAGIAGQSEHGAQSVALSGGYEDDEDHGEWFLYTGSGGRDLSGNKRTNKEQSFDQKFEKLNEALRVSCKKGYPVRVVRSHKEKRSSYAPETGVRYDGIYRIEKCWRKVGMQGFKVCRYLFVRCDNEPAPWTSDEHGDRPRPLPIIKELKKATDITERKESPAWDYIEEHGWKWTKPPPVSRKQVNTVDPEERKRARVAIRQTQNHSVRYRLLKEFSCQLCHKVMSFPLTTPCAHNFCKPCLEGEFAGMTFVRERTREGGRMLRAQKNIMNCPCCPNDISDFLQNPQVNRELMDVIQSLQRKTEESIEASGDGDDSIEKSETAGDGEEGGPEIPEVPTSSDGEVPITESMTTVTYKRKARNGVCSSSTDAKPKNSKESEEAGPGNPDVSKSSDEDDEAPITESKPTETYKRKTRNGSCSSRMDVAKSSKKSEEVEPGNPEMPKSGDKDNEVPTESTPRETYKRKTRNGGCSLRIDVKEVKNSKTSEEVEPKNPEMPKSGDEDAEVPIIESKPTQTYKRITRSGGCSSSTDVKKVKNSKKSEEVEPEKPKSGGSKEGEDPIIQCKPTETSKRQTRNSLCLLKTEVKVAKGTEMSKEAGPENPKMPESGDKNIKVPITESKTNGSFKRKTRSGGCLLKTDVKKAMKSKKSKVEVEGDNSPSSPLIVPSDDDDFE